MAYTKRTWLGRQGTGLNKFSIGGATPVTIVNQPDSVTQVGDALSAGNLNDLEDRIEDAFDDVDTALDTKADEQDVTNLNNAITNLDHRVENLEQAKGDYIVSTYKDGSITPSGKGDWAIVEGLRGVSRVENNQLPSISTFNTYQVTKGTTVDNVLTVSNFTGLNAQVYCNCPISLGRTVLAGVYLKPSVQTTAMLVIGSQKFVENVVCPANTWTFLGNVITISGTADVFSIYPNRGNEMGSADSAQIKLVGLTDLNVYFGGSIPSDAQTLADIQQNYPHLLQPSDYGTRIVDWTGNGVESGIDLVNGSIDGSGNDTPSDSRVRSSFVPVSGAITIAIDNPSAGQIITEAHYYNSAKSWLSYEAVSNTSKTLTIPSSCKYLKFILRNSNQTTTTPLEWAGKLLINNVHIERFLGVLSFPSTSLKSAGSVRDTLELNVEVDGVAKKRTTERIGSVDLGSLSWTKYQNRFYATLSDAYYSSDNTINLLCEKYIAKAEDTQGYMWLYTGRIYIHDENYANEFAFKTAMDGVVLYYPLADPVVTLSDPLIDNTLLTESGGRMATVQTGTVVDGISDLGFITL